MPMPHRTVVVKTRGEIGNGAGARMLRILVFGRENKLSRFRFSWLMANFRISGPARWFLIRRAELEYPMACKMI